jgi:hypothetical protein
MAVENRFLSLPPSRPPRHSRRVPNQRERSQETAVNKSSVLTQSGNISNNKPQIWDFMEIQCRSSQIFPFWAGTETVLTEPISCRPLVSDRYKASERTPKQASCLCAPLADRFIQECTLWLVGREIAFTNRLLLCPYSRISFVLFFQVLTV